MIRVREVARGGLDALAALNDAHAAEVNALGGRAGLAAAVEGAFAARVAALDGPASGPASGSASGPASGPAGFLVAYDGRGACRGPNHAWFRARLRDGPGFAYLDRVVVAPASRGRGVARALHADLAARARSAGLGWVACEVNLDPPNPASLALHEGALGFRAVGEGRDPRGGKVVRYLLRAV